MSDEPDVEAGVEQNEPEAEEGGEVDVGGEEGPEDEGAGDDGAQSSAPGTNTTDKIQFRKAMDSIMVARTGRGPAAVQATQEAAKAQKTMLLVAAAIVGALVLILTVGAVVIFQIIGEGN
ncbi:unnamed protein product [Ixodes hexagonus]